MILYSVNLLSKTLGLRSEVLLLLPQKRLSDLQVGRKEKYPVLYLLHGLTDDHTAWLRWTSLERYAENLNLVIVMPAVHRSFYTDMHSGGKYWSYLSEELPLLLQDIFPISQERRDNFAAGLSMGGYGAFKLALSHPERFAAAASLSGALDIMSSFREGNLALQAEMRSIFGDMGSFENSPGDLYSLAKKVSGLRIKPRLYQSCGTEDFLYQDNIQFRDFIQPLGFDYTYEEGPGDHNWDYWDATIKKVLPWIRSK